MANKFIAFLGTNNYIRCNYFFPDHASIVNGVRFVQEAIISRVCAKWDENDEIFIFLTKDAEKKNWYDGGHTDRNGNVIEKDELNLPVKGLKTQLELLNLKARITPVRNVPEGNSEEEIWKIFSLIEERINHEDTLWLDITHGFRSLPMLVMVLLQYLKTLKKISVGKIYYGAFETLGPADKVKASALDTRNAPILNLTTFHLMQTWTAGADIYDNFGDAGRITEAIQQYCKPVLKSTNGLNITAKRMNELAKLLEETGLMFETVRGCELVRGDRFQKIKQIIKELQNDKDILTPLKPLVGTIDSKINKFNENDIKNGFTAVDWCINHDLIQQGITLLQETMITWLCELHSLVWKIKENRNLISEALNIVALNISPDKWKELSKKRNIESFKIQTTIRCTKDLAANYSRLTELRNDINHGGYLGKNNKADKFKTGLQEICNNIQNILKDKVTI